MGAAAIAAAGRRGPIICLSPWRFLAGDGHTSRQKSSGRIVVIRESPLEELVTMFGDAYKGRHVLVTGHTGFKGSWLALWLKALGAKVTGIALPPETDPHHF